MLLKFLSCENTMDYLGWTVWTEFMMGNADWLSSMNMGTIDEFDPEDDAIPKLFSVLSYFLKESGGHPHLGGCFHFSSDMARIISDQHLFEIYPHYIKSIEKFQEHTPLEIGIHSQFNQYVNPLGNKYHTAFLEDLQRAQNLRATTIVAHPPYNPSWDRDQYKDLLVNDIASEDLVSQLAKTNIIIAWENMIEGQFSSLKELIRFRELLGDKLSEIGYPDLINQHVFCLDTGHLLIWKHSHPKPSLLQEEIEEYLPEFAKLLKVYHIHANDGTSDNHIYPYSLDFFDHPSRSGINKEWFLENSDEVWQWVEICEKYKTLENRHIHSEASKLPFSMDQVIDFGRKYMSLL